LLRKRSAQGIDRVALLPIILNKPVKTLALGRTFLGGYAFMGKFFIHMISGEAQYFLTGYPTLAATVKPAETMLFPENRMIGSMFDWRITPNVA